MLMTVHVDMLCADESTIIIIDRFYIALFSVFEQTHCTRM